jgi:cobalt-zinc-cadmium efflux system outer membrane protein
MSNLKKELAFIMGVEEDLKIDTNDSLYMGVSSDLENLIAQALISRSDILAAQKLIEISNSNIQLQKSLAYPQPELGLIWNPQNRTPYFGVSFSVDLPFFDRNQGEIQKSHLVQRQTEQQLSVIENQLQTEIKTAYNSFQLHQQNIADFKSIMEQSQNILENVRYAYLKGGTTIIDFLEAQRAWLETQQQYYETLQQYHQSYIQLLYATGQIHQLTE